MVEGSGNSDRGMVLECNIYETIIDTKLDHSEHNKIFLEEGQRRKEINVERRWEREVKRESEGLGLGYIGDMVSA